MFFSKESATLNENEENEHEEREKKHNSKRKKGGIRKIAVNHLIQHYLNT